MNIFSRTLLSVMFTLLLCSVFAQQKSATISGYIVGHQSGEDLIGAHIYEPRSLNGTSTNYYGFFSLTLLQGPVKLRVSYAGYQAQVLDFVLKEDTTIKVFLEADSALDEVLVEADAYEPTARTSYETITRQQIEQMPAIGGEPDVLKVLQLMPGVQQGQEGTSGIYVRGGNQDQNLILLDGVPVYNASHLFGFMSVFNTSAISSLSFYKGDFPARYGGRLSSVIDVKMKEGNNQEFHGEASVGLIASKVTVEGPIIKGKSAYIFSARRTYADIFTRPFQAEQGYYFYDINAKVNHRFSDRDRLLFSFYSGKDRLFGERDEKYGDSKLSVKKKEESSLRWGNVTSILRWNHVLTDKLFFNLSVVYSDYKMESEESSFEKRTVDGIATTRLQQFNYQSEIQDYSIKGDVDFIPSPNHNVKLGAAVTHHTFRPGITAVETLLKTDTTLGTSDINAIEWTGYLEDEISIGQKFNLNLGVYAAIFDVENALYQSIQPRISARYRLAKTWGMKAAYVQTKQFLHLLTNSGVGLPTDLWVPATARVKPQSSEQYSMGVTFEPEGKLVFEVDGYYKTMSNIIEYEDGASYLNVDGDWQNKIEVGQGEAYGIEFIARKKTGQLTGWAAYTWARSTRSFENIDDGRTFPFRYDRRHKIDLVGNYQLAKNKRLSATWTYASGAAVTLPSQRFVSNDTDFTPVEYQHIQRRNGFRMSDTHRLDLGYAVSQQKKHGEGTWVFSIYNAYWSKNPFTVRKDEKFIRTPYGTTGFVSKVSYKETSLFPIIPSIAYKFTF